MRSFALLAEHETGARELVIKADRPAAHEAGVARPAPIQAELAIGPMALGYGNADIAERPEEAARSAFTGSSGCTGNGRSERQQHNSPCNGWQLRWLGSHPPAFPRPVQSNASSNRFLLAFGPMEPRANDASCYLKILPCSTHSNSKEVSDMFTKSTIALAMALTLGLTSVALAARSGGNGRGGSRVLAQGQAASSGINPAEHRALAAPKEPPIMNEGKCWGADKSSVGGWTNC
jgi:hypothetical protein